MVTVLWQKAIKFVVSLIFVSLTSIFASPRVFCCRHSPKLLSGSPAAVVDSFSQKYNFGTVPLHRFAGTITFGYV